MLSTRQTWTPFIAYLYFAYPPTPSISDCLGFFGPLNSTSRLQGNPMSHDIHMSSQPSAKIQLYSLRLIGSRKSVLPRNSYRNCSLSPRKYLQYLGWSVIGVLIDEQGNETELNGELLDQGVYHYIVPDQDALAHAVDLEVIKQRFQVPS